jgi:filamin
MAGGPREMMGDEWKHIQEKTFTRWCNEHLKDREFFIRNMATDFKDGVKLCHLLEIISGKSVGPFNNFPKHRIHALENLSMALKFLTSEGLKLVNISNDDIYEGRLTLIMGLIWTVILRYIIQKGEGDGKSARNELLEWVRSKIPEYDIKNFTTDWNDGRAINALNNALYPGLCPDHKGLNPTHAYGNARRGIEDAEKKLGVAKLIYPEEMIHPKVDEHAMMAHIAQYRDAQPRRDDAAMTKAWGPGLKDTVTARPTPFWVKTPPDAKGKLQIRVEGPKSDVPVQLIPQGDGNYTVIYTPEMPGHYKVHVTMDGKHIPGSIFHVVVAEGHVRLFFGAMGAAKASAMKQLEAGIASTDLRGFESWEPIDHLDEGKRQQVLQGKPGKVRAIMIVIDDDESMSIMANQLMDPIVKFAKEMKGGVSQYSQAPSPAKAAPAKPAPAAPAATPRQAPAAAKRCTGCGAPLEAGVKFCTGCGSKI